MKNFNQAISLITVWLCLAIFLFVGLKAYAFTSCGDTFIDKGDTVSELVAKCGRPEFSYETSGGGARKRTESWSHLKLK